jgi:hypothetical protein
MADDILDDEGSIDMKERAGIWRAQGWTTVTSQQVVSEKDDAFHADATAGIGRYTRQPQATSPLVRGYDLAVDLSHDVVDDVIPTGHQRDVMISRIAILCPGNR